MNEQLKPMKARRPWINRAIVISFGSLLALQLTNIQKAVKETAELKEPLVSYEELVPDKPEYHPGELAHFTYKRKASVKGGPLLLLLCDAFENQDTGEIFQGVLASRIVRESGIAELTATRRLPSDCSPGLYVFEGWASSQTVSGHAMPAIYSSRQFRVLGK